MSSVAPPSPACLVLPLSQPVGTCSERWRKLKLIWRVRLPSVMKLLFFSFTACFWFYPCIHSWVCQDGAVNNEVTVVASVPCRVMHLLLVILHHNWEQREMLKKREICSAFSVWWCPKQQKPFDEFCAKRFSSKKDKRCRMWLFEEGHLEANGHKVIREEKHWHFIKIGQC